jgi:hypothetical protein
MTVLLQARVLSSKRAVQARHGNVAESEFRKWLINFLPKRYGVTFGYIISQGLPNTENMIHYDVIIYVQFESPILWVDEKPRLIFFRKVPGNTSGIRQGSV